MTFGGGDEQFAAIGNTDQQKADRLVDIAIEHGVTLFDTSDNYARGVPAGSRASSQSAQKQTTSHQAALRMLSTAARI
jgi:aryl-alcohol dehydrogenase-like predicted oxidoreductase